jgi:hypothetical protein
MRVNYKYPAKLTKQDKKKKRMQKALNYQAKKADEDMADDQAN